MEELGIPTAGVQILKSDSDIDAALSRYSSPWVIKRDVLAAGKGVVVTEDVDEASSFHSRFNLHGWFCSIGRIPLRGGSIYVGNYG